MKTLKHFLISTFLFWASVGWTAPLTTNFQAHIAKPDGTDLESNNVTFNFRYKNDAGTCTLFIENYPNIDMTGSGGDVDLKLGAGIISFPVAGVSLNDIFSNNPTNTMNCAEGGNYTPTLPSEKRKVVVEFYYTGSNGLQSLAATDINSVPYAMYAGDADNLGGFAANLYAKFSDVTTCVGGQFLTFNGTVFSCAAPASFSGTLSGDVTGTQNATVLSRIRGTSVSAAVPASGEYLGFDGTTWKPMPVSGAAGGTVTSVTSANLYLSVAASSSNPVLTVNVGQAANTVAAGDDARIVGAWQSGSALSGDVTGTLANNTVSFVGTKTAAQVNTSVNDTLAATSLNTPSTIVKRDASGDVTVSRASAVDFSGRNFLFYDSGVNKITVKSPNALTSGDYTLTLPDGTGTNGYVLSTNGAGVTSWIPAATGSVTNVTATAPVQSSGGATPNITLAKATAGADGYLASTDWTIFNNKQNTLAAANAATDGYLTSSDWTTFNSKQAAGNYITQLSGDVTGTGPGITTVTLATITSGATVGSASAVPTITYDDKGRITGTSSNAYQDATGVGKGIVQIGNNINVAGGVISVATASSTTTGVLSSADFSSFADKVSSQWTTSSDGTSIYRTIGNVGIGTSASSSKLDVAGVTTFRSAGDPANNFMSFNFNGNPPNANKAILSYTMDNFNSTSIRAATYLNGGYVSGISTNSYWSEGSSAYVNPASASADNWAMDMRSCPDGFCGAGQSGFNILYAVPTSSANPVFSTYFKIMSNGRVGIGTTNPGYALDVSGDINIAAGRNFKINGVNINAGTVTSVTAGAPLASSGGATPNITLAKATAGADGYLASTDWTIFNNKQNTLAAANAATDGYLTSADWTTFNSKQAAGNYITQLSGDVTGTGPGVTTVTLATVASAGTVGSASAVPTITYDAKGRITGTSSNAYQDATGVTKGIVQVGNNINVAGGVISVATASSTTTGVLSSADFSSFTNKVSSQWTTSTDTTSVYYNGGKIGIGTTAPTATLAVTGNAGVADIGKFEWSSANTNLGTDWGVTLSNTNSTDGNYNTIWFSTKDTGGSTRWPAAIQAVYTSHAVGATATDLLFKTTTAVSATEAMRIKGSGNVGIGTAVPSAKLHVVGAIKATALQDVVPQNYYVNSATGSDTNDGSGGAPFQTIAKAVSSIPNGGSGTIWPTAGLTYNITTIIPVENKVVTFANHAASTVTFNVGVAGGFALTGNSQVHHSTGGNAAPDFIYTVASPYVFDVAGASSILTFGGYGGVDFTMNANGSTVVQSSYFLPTRVIVKMSRGTLTLGGGVTDVTLARNLSALSTYFQIENWQYNFPGSVQFRISDGAYDYRDTNVAQTSINNVNQFAVNAPNGTYDPLGLIYAAGASNVAFKVATASGDASIFVAAGNGSYVNGTVPGDSGIRINSNYGFHIGTALNNRLSIIASGDVGIGTAAPTEKLEVNGNIKATTVILSSDRHLKKNILPLQGSLDKILQLQGMQYNWRTEQYPERHFDSLTHYGFIAQDIKQIYPDLVHGQDGNMSVDYPSLIAPMTEAIKEQQQMISGVEAQCKMQSAQVEKLSRDIASLQDQVEKQNKIIEALSQRLEKLEKKK